MDGFRSYETKKGIVFWPTSEGTRIYDSRMLHELVDLRKNARICLHESTESPYHDMIIIERGNNHPFPLHRHKWKSESLTVLYGILQVNLNNGPEQIMKILARTEGIRILPGTWHQTVPLGDYVIYRETKPGPFQESDNEIWKEPKG